MSVTYRCYDPYPLESANITTKVIIYGTAVNAYTAYKFWRYCPKCGWIWADMPWKYCPYCGSELDKDC